MEKRLFTSESVTEGHPDKMLQILLERYAYSEIVGTFILI